MLCRRTRKFLELLLFPEVFLEAHSASDTPPGKDRTSVVDDTKESLSKSPPRSGRPSIFRKSETFIRAVDSPTESPNCKVNNKIIMLQNVFLKVYWTNLLL